MTDKVLFLDIDGPMIPGRSWVSQGKFDFSRDSGIYDTFDPIAVDTINKLIDKTGLEIVVSSAWRNKGFDYVMDVFEKNGLSPEHVHDDWRTIKWPDPNEPFERDKEINEWLSRHPEVTLSAAIDDSQLSVANFVKVTFEDGMLSAQQSQLFSIFGIKYPC